MAFDETLEKRKKFIEIAKKKNFKNFLFRSIIIEFQRNDMISANFVSYLLENQDSPAKLWDNTALDDNMREGLFNALFSALDFRIDELNDEISSVKDLKNELLSIPDEDINSITDSPSLTNVSAQSDNLLYHATPRSNLPAIERTGLLTMGRSHVFLWKNSQDAINVALRHGDADIALIHVDVDELKNDGFLVEERDFGHGDGMQWCVEGNIPSNYLVFAN